MKALLAATCVAVLAVVGYYFWGEWQKHAAAQEYADNLASAKADLFRLAQAEPYEVEKAIKFCKLVRDSPKVMTTEYGAKRISATCAALRY